MASKQEVINEIARYERLQYEQPDVDYSRVINELWAELYEILDRDRRGVK